jgi:hypothetical protein
MLSSHALPKPPLLALGSPSLLCWPGLDVQGWVMTRLALTSRTYTFISFGASWTKSCCLHFRGKISVLPLNQLGVASLLGT